MQLVEIIRKDGEYDTIEAYDVSDFPYERLNKKKVKLRQKHGRKGGYVCTFGTFDIETTTIVNENYKNWVSTGKRKSLDREDAPTGFMYIGRCVSAVMYVLADVGKNGSILCDDSKTRLSTRASFGLCVMFITSVMSSSSRVTFSRSISAVIRYSPHNLVSRLRLRLTMVLSSVAPTRIRICHSRKRLRTS